MSFYFLLFNIFFTCFIRITTQIQQYISDVLTFLRREIRELDAATVTRTSNSSQHEHTAVNSNVTQSNVIMSTYLKSTVAVSGTRKTCKRDCPNFYCEMQHQLSVGVNTLIRTPNNLQPALVSQFFTITLTNKTT